MMNRLQYSLCLVYVEVIQVIFFVTVVSVVYNHRWRMTRMRRKRMRLYLAELARRINRDGRGKVLDRRRRHCATPLKSKAKSEDACSKLVCDIHDSGNVEFCSKYGNSLDKELDIVISKGYHMISNLDKCTNDYCELDDPTNESVESLVLLKKGLNKPRVEFSSLVVVPSEIQVYYLAASSHPREVYGIPWKYLNNEWYRLMSFVMFPSDSPVSTILLASKGFAYLGTDNTIICCFCATLLHNPANMNHIDEEHKRFRKDCPMVKGANCGNIPMKTRYPSNAETLFSNFMVANQNGRPVVPPHNSITDSQHQAAQNIIASSSSQPSNESASYTIVTSTTDLEESDATAAASELQVSGILPQSHRVIYNSSSSSSTIQNQATAAVSSSSPTAAAISSPSPAVVSSSSPTAAVVSSSSPTAAAISSPSPAVVSSPSPTAAAVSSPSPIAVGGVDQVYAPPGHANDVVASSTSPQENTQQNTENPNSNKPAEDTPPDGTSYEKLGIITARPKRPEYAVVASRVNSFREWPTRHHMKPEEMVAAGFFYTGYSDCARCFYCGGGLRNWEAHDNAWVEHARLFPKCAFLLQEVGKDFIDTVQAMTDGSDQITKPDALMEKLFNGSNYPTALSSFKEGVIQRDPAVLSLIESGYDSIQVFLLAQDIRTAGELLSSDKLYEAAKLKGLPHTDRAGGKDAVDSVSVRIGGDGQRDRELVKTLREENSELRQQTICKICMDAEVAVVFLPCGHFVSCTECSCALIACPLCRVGIKGIVRAYMP